MGEAVFVDKGVGGVGVKDKGLENPGVKAERAVEAEGGPHVSVSGWSKVGAFKVQKGFFVDGWLAGGGVARLRSGDPIGGTGPDHFSPNQSIDLM